MNDELTTKLREALTPLQAIDATIASKLAHLEKEDTSIQKELSTQVLSLGSALSKATTKILLHSKEHPSQQSSSHVEFGLTVVKQLTDLSASVDKIKQTKDEPEVIVIETMNSLNQLCTNFNKQYKSSDPTLQEAIAIVGRTANYLSSTAQNMLNNKRAAK